MLGLAFLLVAGACASVAKPQGWAAPELTDDTLYVSIDPGKMAALDPQDFSAKWVFPPNTDEGKKLKLEGIYGAPIVEAGNVYFGGYDGYVYAVSAADGRELWRFKTNGPIIGGLDMADGTLFAGSDDGKLYGLDPEKGTLKLGPFATGDSIWTRPLIDGSTIYVSSVNGKLFALDTTTLDSVWDRPFEAAAGLITDPMLADKGTILVGGIDTKLYAVDAATGKEKWSFKANNWFWGRPLVDKNTIYVTNLDRHVYALDAATGKPVWDNPFPTEAPVRSSPLLAGDVLLVVDRSGNVYAVDPATGKSRWTAPTLLQKTVLTDPFLLDKDVLVLAQGGDLYRIKIDPDGGSQSLVEVKS